MTTRSPSGLSFFVAVAVALANVLFLLWRPQRAVDHLAGGGPTGNGVGSSIP
jgi:hypothetical protein